VEWRHYVQGKKGGRILILGYFYIILSLEVGRKLCLQPSGQEGYLGGDRTIILPFVNL
jgi:hypothetical protein